MNGGGILLNIYYRDDFRQYIQVKETVRFGRETFDSWNLHAIAVLSVPAHLKDGRNNQLSRQLKFPALCQGGGGKIELVRRDKPAGSRG